MDPVEIIQRQLEMTGHLDSSQSLFFARQLEMIKAQTFDVKYPELIARTLMPVDGSADPGAETITYRQFDKYGTAKLAGNGSDDAPASGVKAKEFTQKVFTFETSYEFTLQDIRRASFTGTPLDPMLANAARRNLEEAFDFYAFFGNTALATKGLYNHADIPLVVLPNLGAFSSLTPQQQLDNLNALVGSIPQTTESVHRPDTLLLDTFTFTELAQTNVGLDNQMSVMRSFLANNPYISGIEESNRLNTAGAGDIRRIVAYKRDPMVLELNIPMEFTPAAPQARGTKFVVPVEGRIGGLELHYPKAVAHADIATS